MDDKRFIKALEALALSEAKATGNAEGFEALIRAAVAGALNKVAMAAREATEPQK